MIMDNDSRRSYDSGQWWKETYRDYETFCPRRAGRVDARDDEEVVLCTLSLSHMHIHTVLQHLDLI